MTHRLLLGRSCRTSQARWQIHSQQEHWWVAGESGEGGVGTGCGWEGGGAQGGGGGGGGGEFFWGLVLHSQQDTGGRGSEVEKGGKVVGGLKF